MAKFYWYLLYYSVFECIYKYVEVCDDDFTNAGELIWGLWGYLCFICGFVLENYIEHIGFRIRIDVCVVDFILSGLVGFLVGDIAVSAEEVVHGVLYISDVMIPVSPLMHDINNIFPGPLQFGWRFFFQHV